MRLFQSQICFEDFNPPPPFLKDPTKENLKSITHHHRDEKQRLPTPEKMAIMELSGSFEKRRLGKQQQILTDMTQRCREQEVADLSSKLTNKCTLLSAEKRGKEVTFYATTFSHKRQMYGGAGFLEDGISMTNPTALSPKTAYVKNYQHFPARKIIKQPGKYDFVKTQPKSTPRPTGSPNHVIQTSAPPSLTDNLNRNKLAQTQRINGSIQLDHYITPRSDHLAPLVLPSLDGVSQERDETYFSTARVNIGSRAKTLHGSDALMPTPSTGSKPKNVPRLLKPMQHGMSDFHHLQTVDHAQQQQRSPRHDNT